MRFKRRKSSVKPLEWKKADDIKQEVVSLVTKLNLKWINLDRVYCVRSNHSQARAYARIWGMSRIWQETLGIPPAYCIEVLSEKFDHLPQHKKAEIILHELAHIPKNFSGALTPHNHSKGGFHEKLKLFLAAYKRG